MSRFAGNRPVFISAVDFVKNVMESGDWQGYKTFISERNQDPELQVWQTATYAQKSNIDKHFEVRRVNTGHMYYVDRKTGEPPVFFAPGFATLVCVPPITHGTQLNRQTPHKWKQTINISGISDSAFALYKEGYDNLLHRLMAECTDIRYDPPRHYGDQYPTIQASTPMLTECAYSTDSVERLAIPTDVDTCGILEELCSGGRFCYLEENHVSYQAIFDKDVSGCFRISDSSPARLKRGALVEIGMSFIVRPGAGRDGFGHRIECLLENVLLISDDAATAMHRPVRRAATMGPLPFASRKREAVDLSGSYKRRKATNEDPNSVDPNSVDPREVDVTMAATQFEQLAVSRRQDA